MLVRAGKPWDAAQSGEADLMFALPSSSRISQALSHVANAGLGTAMLYELIEVRGMLTWQNVLFKLEQFVLREAMSLESNTSGVMKFLFK